MNNYTDLIATYDITILDAMKCIDYNSCGILFLVKDDVLVGCLTDGDIRRFLLSGGNTSDSVSLAMNKAPKIACSEDEAKEMYHSKNWIAIPVVDEGYRILNIYLGNNENIHRRAELHVPVVINAGGRGTRLDPFTRVLPKPLIPVGEIPIIEHIMQEYQSYSCDKFHIIVNYKRELMRAYFAECERRYNVTWYDEFQPLGTGGGLSLLRGTLNETFFFTNCDNLLRTNYESILKFHKERHNVITMICSYKSMTIPYGVVEMGLNGVIEEMKEKPSLSFLTNTGIYLVEPEVLEDIEDNISIGFPEVVLKQKAKGRNVAVYPIRENEWMDMGKIDELEKMRLRLYGE